MARVWALTGARVGDNAQVLRLAGALGFETQQIPLAYNAARVLPNWLLGASLWALDGRARDIVRPPWPDLVIGAGRRSVPVARWIQRQSGGKTRSVFLGRPRAPLSWFDLVITTPQYGLPREANVIMVPLPYADVPQPPDDLENWLTGWARLTRPLTAVLVGGRATPYRLDAISIDRLVETAGQVAGGGTAIYVTSPRTSSREAGLLEKAVGGAGEVWRWAKGAPNPYAPLLVEADRFVVTEDSVSMTADAMATGKPVTISTVKRRLTLSWCADNGLFGMLARNGLLTPPRDVHRLMLHLADSGQATMPDRTAGNVAQDMKFATWPEAIARVKELLR